MHLLDFPEELEIILNAARMMDAKGLQGEANRSLRTLLVQAYGISKMLTHINPNAVVSVANQQSYATQSWMIATGQQTERCTTYATTCPTGRCPGSDGCFGMCGFGCNCLQFVCGNCCTNHGCIEHDRCCRKGGFFATLRCYTYVGFCCNCNFPC